MLCQIRNKWRNDARYVCSSLMRQEHRQHSKQSTGYIKYLLSSSPHSRFIGCRHSLWAFVGHEHVAGCLECRKGNSITRTCFEFEEIFENCFFFFFPFSFRWYLWKWNKISCEELYDYIFIFILFYLYYLFIYLILFIYILFIYLILFYFIYIF